MVKTSVKGTGTREKPWVLKTPLGTSEFQVYRDEAANPPALVCRVGSTELRYQLRCLTDLQAMLKAHGDWMDLGGADEQKHAEDGEGRDRGGGGAPARQPRPRLVRPEEGAERSLRSVRSAGDGGARSRGGRAQSEEQPDAGPVGVRTEHP